jgi:hypothetical protein
MVVVLVLQVNIHNVSIVEVGCMAPESSPCQNFIQVWTGSNSVGNGAVNWSQIIVCCKMIVVLVWFLACGGVLGWGAMLQARRLQVNFTLRLLDCSVDPIVPAALWALELTHPLNRNEYQESPCGVKGGWRVRLTASLRSFSRLSRKCGSLDIWQPCMLPRLVTGKDSFTVISMLCWLARSLAWF